MTASIHPDGWWLHPTTGTHSRRDRGPIPDGELEKIRRVDIPAREAIDTALRTGPAETVLERIDWRGTQLRGALAAQIVSDLVDEAASAENTIERLTDELAQCRQQLEDRSAVCIDEGFDPRGHFVYLLRETPDADPIYVGMSSNVLARLGAHAQDRTRRFRIAHVSVIRCRSAEDARDMESRLIARFRPELNIAGVA